MSRLSIGTLAGGDQLWLDIPTLIHSRALITGNSGAGKSRLMRRMAEQAFGKVQQIIVDCEGEFATLRERHDFLLAGKGGEVPAEPRAAALLARRLMELRASAVLDLYDLKIDHQRAFVRLFLESLLSLPRDVYRPVLLMIDEVHRFAPERGHGEAESTGAVVDLMSQGRKRGLCGVLASQRMSKVSKDAAADAANGFVGRTTLDVDQKRAADVLGLTTRAEVIALRDLENGVFHAYGPAISSKGVVRFCGGEVETTHPKAGEAHKVVAPAPPGAIRKLADELKDLPQQAAEELRSLTAAQARVRELERDLREAQKAQPPPPPAPKTIERAVLKDAQVKRLEAAVERLLAESARAADTLAQRQQVVVISADMLAKQIKVATAAAAQTGTPVMGNANAVGAGRPAVPSRPAPVVSRAPVAARRSAEGASLGGTERRVLACMAAHAPISREDLGLRCGYRADAGHFGNVLSTLRSAALIGQDGDGRLALSVGGMAVVADGLGGVRAYSPGELREVWLRKLGRAERATLEWFIATHPMPQTRESAAEGVGLRADAGHFGNILSTLRSNGLITRGQQMAVHEALVG